MKKTEEEVYSDYLKSNNFRLVKTTDNYCSRRMTKNRKMYEWQNMHMTILYEISKDSRKKNVHHIIDRNIHIIKNKQKSRITCLSALKHAIESDTIFSRKAKLKKLFRLQ